MHRPLRVAQVNIRDDRRRETVRIAWALHRAYQRIGIDAWMAVGRKFSIDPNVFEIPNEEARPGYAKALLEISCLFQLMDYRFRGAYRISQLLKWLVEPRRYWRIRQGIEDFHYPGTRKILDLYPQKPDILHCHHLRGYFDLRALPWLSQKLPVVLTLHDAWLLSGHCRDSLDCERWKTGCGRCPYLEIPYPVRDDTALNKDATRYNWHQKQKIFARSKVYLASPSRWLMDKVKQSYLADAIVEQRVIPYGVDLSVFHTADKQIIRQGLKIRPYVKVILSATIPAQENTWGDYQTIRDALRELSSRLPELEALVIAFGKPAPSERIGKIEIRFLLYPKDPNVAARYYQAADVYVHAGLGAVFPLTILEALASGLPVVATATGGVPEQIEDGINGFLIPRGDIPAMALHLHHLLTDETLRQRMSRQAAETASAKFSLRRQVNDYLKWYEELR